MSGGEVVRLRDRRKPGHAWQDNELYDFFQPIIGAQATALYGNLSREAYGVRIEYSARLMAERTGMSRMTIWRAMAVMTHLGMVRAVPGRGSAAGAIELVDLKELAAALGGTPVDNGKSHVAAPDLLRRLRAECLRACVPQRDANDHGKPPVCVPIGDASGTLVSQKGGVCVPPGDAPSILETRHKTQNNFPPQVPQADARGTGRADSDSAEGELLDARERVCRECGWTKRRLKRAVEEQLALRRGESPGAQADRMIAQWHTFCDNRDLLFERWTALEFLESGHWRTDSATWRWDRQAIDASRPDPAARREPSPDSVASEVRDLTAQAGLLVADFRALGTAEEKADAVLRSAALRHAAEELRPRLIAEFKNLGACVGTKR